MSEQLRLDLHWPVTEIQTLEYAVDGRARTLTWEKWWCSCGDRTCGKAWEREVETMIAPCRGLQSTTGAITMTLPKQL